MALPICSYCRCDLTDDDKRYHGDEIICSDCLPHVLAGDEMTRFRGADYARLWQSEIDAGAIVRDEATS